eukprot:CAMPEP_0206284654 /NCGR_PEP_ID=MMETSP0047_2-20121206/40888_1 /ASSEMBLY_ACC=CAM_ASM_000192 /TAXON_ID=195065 /ORGANISM="Chroomonas mesostigmatica_cf, Strain CCMP1168" /LENGTH=228 /DNA_ID=CAMNT_0053715119 /DNA_START=255 /DNA_END=941 /DNA_ORIENTATION=-
MVVKAITFDLDDTLWETMPSLMRAHEMHISFVNSNYPKIELDGDKLKAEMKSMREVLDDGGADLSKLRRSSLESLAKKAGYDNFEEVAGGAMEVFMRERNNVDVFEGVLDTLQSLRDRGLVLGAITNGNADVEQTPLRGMLHFSVLAGKLGTLKPGAEPFMEAARQAGADVKEMVHVGDDLVTDVQGARGVGMRTVWLKRKGKELEGEAPDGVIESVKELPALLEPWY